MLNQLCILIAGVNELQLEITLEYSQHNLFISHVNIYRQERGSPRNEEDRAAFEKCTGFNRN
jgi:hypothetical protein